MKKQNQQTTSEATTATPNRNVRAADLLRDMANRLQAGTHSSMTDEHVNEFASVIYTLLRDCGCNVSITTPQEVIDEAESRGEYAGQDLEDHEFEPTKLTSEEAKRICEDLQDSDWLGQEFCDTLNTLIDDAIEARKGASK